MGKALGLEPCVVHQWGGGLADRRAKNVEPLGQWLTSALIPVASVGRKVVSDESSRRRRRRDSRRDKAEASRWR